MGLFTLSRMQRVGGVWGGRVVQGVVQVRRGWVGGWVRWGRAV